MFTGCASGYPKVDYDKDGYNKNGYDKYGYDRGGYNRQGYNKAGYNKFGYHWNGYNKEGFDEEGFDEEGFNRSGYNKNGQTKTEIKNIIQKKYKKLLLAKDNVDFVFKKLLKDLKKDKYVKDKIYFTRIKKLEKNAVLELELKTEYDPNNEVYKFIIGSEMPYLSYKNKYKYGKEPDSNDYDYFNNKDELNNFTFTKIMKSFSYTSLGSNVYGFTKEIVTNTKEGYVFVPNNFNNVLDSSSMKTQTIQLDSLDRYQNNYFINKKIDVEQAKIWDKEKFKMKINLDFDNKYDLYKGTYYKDATIDSPYAKLYTYKIFKGDIKDLIIYNKKTKSIIFSYSK
jgi:hypothetical protein